MRKATSACPAIDRPRAAALTSVSRAHARATSEPQQKEARCQIPLRCWSPTATTRSATSSSASCWPTASGRAGPQRRRGALRAARGPDLLVLGELEQPAAALRLLRAIRSGDGLAGRDRPGAAGDRAVRRRRRVGAAARLRGGLRRLPAQARPLPRAARPRAAVLRRATPGAAAARRVGALAVDPRRREARYAGRRLELSRLEFELLAQLAADPLRVFTKRELLREVWGYRADGRDAHARRARLPAAAQARRGAGRAATSSTCAASATGCSAGPRRRSTMTRSGEPRRTPRAP